MRTTSLRSALVLGLFAALAACSASSAEEGETDEGALEEERAEADARLSAQEITEIRCDVDNFLGKDVALSKQNYKKLPADYESKTAAEKQAILWGNIAETAYPSACRPDGGFGFIGKSILSLIKGGLDQTWRLTSDEMPEGRVKFLRPFGTAATFEMETLASSPYSGVLKGSEKVLGVMRFSNVGAEDKSGFVPGVAFKFLVDGKPSGNTMAMWSMLPQKVEGKDDRNFFKFPMRNWFPSVSEQMKLDHVRLPPLKIQITQLVFEQSFGNKPNRMEVDELAKFEPSGVEVPAAARKYPRNLDFKPTQALTAMYKDALARDPKADYRDVLKKIEPGTVMYDVVAYEDDGYSQAVPVGTLKLTSKILPSAWADYRLFFKHSAKNSKHENEY